MGQLNLERLASFGDAAARLARKVGSPVFWDDLSPIAEALISWLSDNQGDPRGFDPGAESLAVQLLGCGARLLVDPDDQMAWRALVWWTPRLGRKRLERILTANTGDFKRNLESVADTDSTCHRPLSTGRQLIERLSDQEEVASHEVVQYLADSLGIARVDLQPLDALNEKLGDSAQPSEWVDAVIELSQQTLLPPDKRPSEIPVRTVFGAKGLEAPIVFVVNAIQQTFTGRGSPADGVRRLYVAITRAQQQLIVTAPRFLGYTPLRHMVGSATAGLTNLITASAARIGLAVEAL